MFTVVYGGVRWRSVVYGGYVGVWWCMAYIMYNITRHLQPEQAPSA
jgi:hypothetical protein